jgi:hypothetical protein
MAWILAFALFFAVFVVLDVATWHTALWSAPWKAAAALTGARLCNLTYRVLTWRPADPRNAVPPLPASSRSV